MFKIEYVQTPFQYIYRNHIKGHPLLDMKWAWHTQGGAWHQILAQWVHKSMFI